MDWLARIRSNPDKTLSTIYDELKPEALSWIAKEFSLSTIDAEETFHLGIVLFYDNVMTGKLTELTSSIKTYIFAIIKNKVVQHNRIQSKTQLIEDNTFFLNQIFDEYEETNVEDLQKARIAMHQLGDPCKSLLELFYYQQMNMDEISTILGYKNTDTTKNQKYKCMKRLQNIFFELKSKQL